MDINTSAVNLLKSSTASCLGLGRFTLGLAMALAIATSSSAAVYDQPSTSNSRNLISGTTPSGLSWEYVASGSAIPLVSSNTAYTGAPGAVAYFNTTTGQLQIDPKGWNLSLFNFTYTTGTVNTSGTTPGPFLYSSGTSPTSAIVSGATGVENQKTLPAGSWTLITSASARIAGTVSLVRVPTLSTAHDSGNGASGSSFYTTNPRGDATVAGWLNQPWSFPHDNDANTTHGALVNSGSVSTMLVSNFKTFGISSYTYADALGYGRFQSTFQYTVDGVSGNFVGAVIPVTTAANITTINVASGLTQNQTEAGYPLLSGSDQVEKTGAGTLVLDQANTLASTINVRAGTVRLATPTALSSGTLSPFAGGVVSLGSQVKAGVAGLAANAGGLVDVGTGAFVVPTAGLSTSSLTTALAKGFAGGAWTGTSGIVSSAAATSVAAGIPRTVGWIETSGSITFGFAAPGDANLDGMIDDLDVAVLLSSSKFGNGAAATWAQGDFNYDGLFDILDVAALASTNLYNGGAYNAPASQVGGLVAVPEPAGFSFLLAASGLGVAAAWRRCRR